MKQNILCIKSLEVAQQESAVEHVQKEFLRHMQELRAWSYTMIRDRSLADDLVQDVFITIYKKADQYTPGTNFRAWMFAIARLKVMEISSRPEAKEVCIGIEVLEKLFKEDEIPPDFSQRARYLDFCFSKLAPHARRLIILRYLRELKPQSIAEKTKGSVNAINVALTRAKMTLKKCIEFAELKDRFSSGGESS